MECFHLTENTEALTTGYGVSICKEYCQANLAVYAKLSNITFTWKSK